MVLSECCAVAGAADRPSPREQAARPTGAEIDDLIPAWAPGNLQALVVNGTPSRRWKRPRLLGLT